MASDSNPVVAQTLSEEQDRMGDAHSKDLEHSNNIQRELHQDDCKRSSLTSLDHYSASSTTEKTESTQVIQSNLSEVTESTLAIQSAPTEETKSTQVIQPAPTEETESTQVIQSALTKETEFTRVIQSAPTEETESTQVIQSASTEETESTQVIQPAPTEETASTQFNQSVPTEETESTRVIQSAPTEETESTQIIQSASTEETESTQVMPSTPTEEIESTQVIQSAPTEETESTQVIQPALVEEIESTVVAKEDFYEETESSHVIQAPLSVLNEVIQACEFEKTASQKVIKPILSENFDQSKFIQHAHLKKTELSDVQQRAVSENVNSIKAIPVDSSESNSRSKTSISSSDSKTTQITLSDKINSSATPEIVSEVLSEFSNYWTSSKENSDSFFPPALETEGFLSLLKTEEYKDATHFVIPGKGHVIVTPTTVPCEPIFPDFVMPELSPPTKNLPMESIKHLSPTKDSTVTTDIWPEKSLSTLLSLIADWAETDIERNYLDHPNWDDFGDYFRRKLQYGLDLLKQMNKRMNTLLGAVDGLPDPTISENELERLRIPIRRVLIDAGIEVQRKLNALEAETIENYKIFVDLCQNNRKLNGEFRTKEAKEVLLESFHILSKDYLELSGDVENFRHLIREFCLQMDSSL